MEEILEFLNHAKQIEDTTSPVTINVKTYITHIEQLLSELDKEKKNSMEWELKYYRAKEVK